MFFLLQPNLMLIEDFAMWLGREKLGLVSKQWRFIGYLWTFLMLVITGTGFVDECVRYKLVPAASAFPFSVAQIFIQG